MSSPVGTQARGEIRRLRARLAAQTKKLAARVHRIPHDTVTGAIFAGKVGSGRCWARILAAMPPPDRLDRPGRLAVWRFLDPIGQILENDQGDAAGDESIIVRGLAIGRLPSRLPSCFDHSWGVTFGSHALARVLERSAWSADPEAVMVEAHETMLGAAAEVMAPLLKLQAWAIPGGPGAFLCSVQILPADDFGPEIVTLFANTWVSTDQLRPEQEAQVAAIRLRQPGPTLADGLLRIGTGFRGDADLAALETMRSAAEGLNPPTPAADLSGRTQASSRRQAA